MKKLFSALALALCLSNLQAQTEIKINPLGALFGSPDISAEFGVSESVGVEPFIGFNWNNLSFDGTKFSSTGFGYGVHGKYYFHPEKGIDKFYGGIYLKGGQGKYTASSSTVGTTESFSNNHLAFGFELGYKWVTNKNIVIELGGGIGRKIFNNYTNTTGTTNLADIPLANIDGLFRFNVGYRFGGGGGGGSSSSFKKKS